MPWGVGVVCDGAVRASPALRQELPPRDAARPFAAAIGTEEQDAAIGTVQEASEVPCASATK